MLVKKGIIEPQSFFYKNMDELSKRVNELVELSNEDNLHLLRLKKGQHSLPKTPKEPFYIDWSVLFITERKDDHYKRNSIKKYNLKYSQYISLLEKYIDIHISKGIISYEILLDFKKIVDYKKIFGYSLNEYSWLLGILNTFENYFFDI